MFDQADQNIAATGDHRQQPQRTINKRYRCTLCPYATNLKNCLTQHQVTHSDQRPWVCADCGKGFKLKQHLTFHTFSHYPDEKPHACDKCPIRCVTGFQLRQHMRRHTGERPYGCDLCSYRGSISKSLKTHRLTHFKKKEEEDEDGDRTTKKMGKKNKKYECAQCSSDEFRLRKQHLSAQSPTTTTPTATTERRSGSGFLEFPRRGGYSDECNLAWCFANTVASRLETDVWGKRRQPQN